MSSVLIGKVIFNSAGRGMSIKAKKALLDMHYLRRLPPVSFGFELWERDDVCAVAAFGVPASRHLQKSACPSNPDLVLELNRLWVSDHMPCNTASEFVRHCMRKMPPRIVVSYADPKAGHSGGVYHAMGFHYAGLTDAERKTPRFDYVPANGKHSRDAFRSGDFIRVRRVPKHKFFAYSGNRRERLRLAKLCGWQAVKKTAGARNTPAAS